MNIADLQLGTGLEVPDRISLNIYFAGCCDNKSCERSKCQNSHLHSFEKGTHYKDWMDEICKILSYRLAETVCFLGGEPFDQNQKELNDLMEQIAARYPFVQFYAYTGYEIERVPASFLQMGFKSIFAGPYVEGHPEYQQWYHFDNHHIYTEAS